MFYLLLNLIAQCNHTLRKKYQFAFDNAEEREIQVASMTALPIKVLLSDSSKPLSGQMLSFDSPMKRIVSGVIVLNSLILIFN